MKRESLNMSNQSPHFQSRSGMLDHIGGTYSHGGMMDCLRIPFLWNGSSRSITGQPNFPDFDMLDEMIASALKKLLKTQSNSRKKD